MKLNMPIEEWVLMKSNYESLPFGEELLSTLEKVTWSSELIMSTKPDDTVAQVGAWREATRKIQKSAWSKEIYEEMLILLVTVWSLGEWFFQEILSPIEQTMFYNTVETRMTIMKEKNDSI